MKSCTNYKVKWNVIQWSYTNYVMFICYNDEKLVCTLFTWPLGLPFHLCAVDGSENVETILNFFPSIGQHFSIDCQYRILKSGLQCIYVRDMRTVDNSLYVSLKESVHRCDIRWTERPSFRTPFSMALVSKTARFELSRQRNWDPYLVFSAQYYG